MPAVSLANRLPLPTCPARAVEAPTAKPAQVPAATVNNVTAPNKPYSTRSSRNITFIAQLIQLHPV